MSIALLFAMLMILWLIFGIFAYWPAQGGKPYPLVNQLLIWVLFFLLGWAEFGALLHK